MRPLTLDHYEALARERMERSAYDYYAGGAGDERTLAANRAAFDAIALRPRVLVDVSVIDTKTTVLGQDIDVPVMLSPTAFNRLAHPDGEMAAARAARGEGTIMIGSTLSTCALEEVSGACGGGLWFQVYVYKDRGLTQELIARAEACGYRALVLTVDWRAMSSPRAGRAGVVSPPVCAVRAASQVPVRKPFHRAEFGRSDTGAVHGLTSPA